MLKNISANNLESIMKNGDKDILNSIPLTTLLKSGFNSSAVAATNLPDAYVLNQSSLIL
jgi:hypothetical protein